MGLDLAKDKIGQEFSSFDGVLVELAATTW